MTILIVASCLLVFLGGLVLAWSLCRIAALADVAERMPAQNGAASEELAPTERHLAG